MGEIKTLDDLLNNMKQLRYWHEIVRELADIRSKCDKLEKLLSYTNNTMRKTDKEFTKIIDQLNAANDDAAGAVVHVEYARQAIRWHCGCLSLPSDTEDLDNWLRAHKERIANDK